MIASQMPRIVQDVVNEILRGMGGRSDCSLQRVGEAGVQSVVEVLSVLWDQRNDIRETESLVRDSMEQTFRFLNRLTTRNIQPLSVQQPEAQIPPATQQLPALPPTQQQPEAYQ
eukprot:PhF_6_TR7059/c0_g1_i2/m.10651